MYIFQKRFWKILWFFGISRENVCKCWFECANAHSYVKQQQNKRKDISLDKRKNVEQPHRIKTLVKSLLTIFALYFFQTACTPTTINIPATATLSKPIVVREVTPTSASTKDVDPSPTPLSSTMSQDNGVLQSMIERCSQGTTENQGITVGRPLIQPGSLYGLMEQDGAWSELTFMEGTPLRTTNPSQAGYLLCVQETKTLVGYYTDKDAGYRVTWNILLISYPEETVQRSISFTGEEPPEFKEFVGPAYGTPPSNELENWVNRWKAATAGSRQSIMKLGQEYQNTSLTLAFTSDGQTLISGEITGDLRLWQLAGGTEPVNLDGFSDEIYDLELSPDGKQLAVAERNGTVNLWDLTTKAKVSNFNIDWGMPKSVAINPDGSLIAVGTADGPIVVFNIDNGETQFTLGQDMSSLFKLGDIFTRWEVSDSNSGWANRGHLGLGNRTGGRPHSSSR